ncbi:MAG: F0F1 ATP synthase subunit epsilon [Gammaproteobacteria bacterium RIFCSPHIGHO2_12_FULL_35_23]|nr:MAG: F0F1 ATP synthase subunit epsilon [Gammaproteobacteria bacterium RIFCSPHIGHO2_12_FULL_35_23]
MAMTLHLDIVSAEQAIFSGRVQCVTVSGQEGDLGIYPGHTPLLTGVKPGEVTTIKQDGKAEVFYISGGMIEVQPDVVTILADTIIRADDIDEMAAKEAQEKALQSLAGKKAKNIDYQRALVELAEASAKLRAVKDLHKIIRKNRLG